LVQTAGTPIRHKGYTSINIFCTRNHGSKGRSWLSSKETQGQQIIQSGIDVSC